VSAARQSSLLIDESPLQVIPSLAVAIGLNEAIMLQQIHYWKNLSPHERDGRRWVAMSTPELNDKFPFWSEKTIKRTVANLRERKLLLITRKSASSWDRANWYAIDYDAMGALGSGLEKGPTSASGQNDPMHEDKVTRSIGSERPDRSGQNDPITNNGKSKDKRTPSEGAKKPPSAVAECWKAYTQGMKSRYGVEPPTNAKANGQLQQIINRVGAEGALQLVGFYVAHNDKFYVTVSHSLDYLVRDCDKRLWIEMGKQTGGRRAPAPTKAEVALLYEDGGSRNLQTYPLGEPLDIAKQCKRDYGGMISKSRPKSIRVQIGGQANTYSIAELDQGRTA
jgi:hypothetical protein